MEGLGSGWARGRCPLCAHMLNEHPLLGAGGCSPRRDVLDYPRATAVPPHSEAAGADGVRDARDLGRSAEESGAVPGGG